MTDLSDFITITKPGQPGGTTKVTRAAYRELWFSRGWVSNEDPGFIPGSAVDTEPFLTVPSGWGTQWRKAKAEAGSRIVRIHAWGDSITVGDDDSPVGTPAGQARVEAWAAGGYFGRAVAALQATYGDAGSGFMPIGLSVGTGTWTASVGYGGCDSRATAAASLTWYKVRGTTVQIFHKNTGISGSYRYQIDGGEFTTVTTPTPNTSIDPGFTEVTGLSDGDHTVRVEWVSGTVGFHGVAGLRGTTGIRPSRCAQHGTQATNYSELALSTENVPISTTNGSATITSAAPGSFRNADVGKRVAAVGIPLGVTIAAVASATSATISANATATGTPTAVFTVPASPAGRASLIGGTIRTPFGLAPAQGVADLVVVNLGVNDPSSLGTTAATVLDGLSSVVKPYMEGDADVFTPDFVFCINHQGNWFDVDRKYAQIAEAIRSMAEGVGGAVIDYWGLGKRSWLYSKNSLVAPNSYWSGVNGDNAIHPSTYGHQLMAKPLIDLLTSR